MKTLLKTVRLTGSLCLLALPCLAQAEGNLPECSALEDAGISRQSSCGLTWVENNQKISITVLRPIDDDSIEFTSNEVGTYTVASPQIPDIIDIDGDGQIDLGFFTPIGMVNGDYTIFRRPSGQDSFVELGVMNGYDFYADKTGFFVADGRSNCCERSLVFHHMEGDALSPRFTIGARPKDMPRPGGGPLCEVIKHESRDGIAPDAFDLETVQREHPELISDYCNYYDNDQRSINDRTTSLRQTSSVPAATVFHCQLEDHIHKVTVTLDDGTYTYRYGPTGQPPELELIRSTHEVSVLPDSGPGPGITGHIEFENNGYVYKTYYTIQNNNAGAPFELRDFTRGLSVRKTGSDDHVFERACLIETSYDDIRSLEVHLRQ